MMKRLPLGSSALEVTPLGLGLAALGRPGYITLGHGRDLPAGREVEAMAHHAHEILDLAWARGIRYFDAARSYGLAERFLGRWLAARDIDADEVTVGSKWGYTYTADWQVDAETHEVKEHSLARLDAQLPESRREIGRYLDLYQIHSATLESGVLDNAPVLDRLAELRTQGLVIGLSLSGAGQSDTLRRALEIERDGRLLFQSVQATWNLLERSAGEALAEAHDAGLGVIVKEALANGRLTNRSDEPALDSLRRVASELAATPDAVAIAAALAQPWADVVLSGAARTAHLEANLGALEIEWSDEIAARLAALSEPPERYWDRRSRLPWN